MYDIIGDIHGHSQSLQALLTRLGYRDAGGVWRHPARTAIFLGDFVDRGPHQKETLRIVRCMIEAGSALAVMGNHEFNAIAFATRDGDSGDYLRTHSEKHVRQHATFLKAFEDDPAGRDDAIRWFKTLPLWLDLGEIRVVHACWDRQAIARIFEHQGGNPLLGETLLFSANRKGSWQYEAIETILKGKEIPLSPGNSFNDKDGNVRHRIRVRWWDRSVRTFRDAFLGSESAKTHIPDDEISGDHLVEYSHDAPPVFLGHYWMEGTPAPLAPNIACLDYSVAKPGGKLVAYRWDGEPVLDPSKFVWVQRLEV
jgi:calcineurin-like phosphoesterase family protein